MGNEIFKDNGSYLEVNISEKIGIFFTTKNGGKSLGAFESNNMAYQVGDKFDLVLENRTNFAKKIGNDVEDFVFANQVHKTNIYEVTSKDKGAGLKSFESGIKNCDVLYTYEKNIPLACFFADCTPVFFMEENLGLVGIIHAGWQGTVKNVVYKTLAELKKKQVDLKNLKIVIGPSIKKDSFVVRKDVYDLFEGSEYSEGCIEKVDDEFWIIDTIKYNMNILLSLGVKKDNIYITNIDTYSANNMFSFRRDGVCGRMIGVIKNAN